MSIYTSKKFLIILIAPSGGGKSSIARRISYGNDNIEYSISYTTRKPRGDEKDGQDYFFVSEEDFKQMIQAGEFAEYANVHDNWYGTSKKFIQDRLNLGKYVIMDIDVQGAKQLIESGIDAVTIFVLPPSEAVLRERLSKRGTDSRETIDLRLNNANGEIDEIDNFQYLVINDDLDEAVEDVKNIIKVEEKKIIRYEKIKGTFYGG